ncbi:transglycosylase SLT domain-containing protein [Methylosinus sp. PW1]|uniref:transglycosylase SLT domain-containing protein n=1 Tax=Methylosinus sp. PW1 TaxID=107636 RepID=UPI0012EBCED2|nr:transglycosylase SLT domain-containing protein [Methylosinus sp. PW1]
MASLAASLIAAAATSICEAHAEGRPISSNICEREMIRASNENAVPLAVLYAVALTETGQKGALNAFAMNVEGRAVFSADFHEAMMRFLAAKRSGAVLIDIGCMQVNHHYHGARFASVEAMFDPRANVDYAARFLKDLHKREGTWTSAVARYHAGPKNAPAQKSYVCAVIANMIASGFGAWTDASRDFCRPRREAASR